MSDQLENMKPADLSSGDRPLSIPPELPILPLRDTVLFPNSFMPLAVARESSVRLIDDAISTASSSPSSPSAMRRSKNPARPISTRSARLRTSTRCSLPDGSLRLIVQGLQRVTLDEIASSHPHSREGDGRGRRHDGSRRARDRRARSEHQDQLPAGRLAVAAPVRRPPDARDQHQRGRPLRRLHRLVVPTISTAVKDVLETLDIRARWTTSTGF
jgi:ATP-dependent Lon protease